MKLRNVCLILICTLIVTIFSTAIITPVHATTFSSKYSLKVNEETIDAKVYIKDGRSYIPIRKLTDALNYSIHYSKLDELNVFHDYDIIGAPQRVSLWGNERWGYRIMQRVGDQDHPDDVTIYKPALDCPNESDNCYAIKDLYEGPIILDKKMYVPVRYLAEALDLQLKLSGNTISIN